MAVSLGEDNSVPNSERDSVTVQWAVSGVFASTLECQQTRQHCKWPLSLFNESPKPEACWSDRS